MAGSLQIDRAPFPVALHYGLGSYRTWGRLAVVANVSDLLAIGAQPRALMLSMVLPSDFSATDAQAIIDGCVQACAQHNVSFVGGDTKEGNTPQIIGAAWGTIEKHRHIGRAQAQIGDALFIAGSLGGFAAALTLVREKNYLNKRAEQSLEVLTLPSARLREAPLLRTNKVSAACDLSDGLREALDIFCGAKLGITLNETKLPLHELVAIAAANTGADNWRFAFAAGDWALAFVVKESELSCFQNAISKDMEIHEIGRFDDSGLKRIRDLRGNLHPIPQLINEQFTSRIEDEGVYLDMLLGKKDD